MTASRGRNRLTRFAAVLASVVATLTLALIWADAAVASQSPGVAAGAASSLSQVMMAILIYGASALVVASGLIGAIVGDDQPRVQ